MFEKAPADAAKPRAAKAKTSKDTVKATPARPAARSAPTRTTANRKAGAGGAPPELQAQIRQRAYELWERDGRPDGRDHAHWQQAEREIGTAPRAG